MDAERWRQITRLYHAARESSSYPTPGLFNSGDLIGDRFRIVRLIGQGGMGAVYEARDMELGGHVALKTIRGETARDPRAIERFKQEIYLARKVTHPNDCRIFDLFYHSPGSPEFEVMFLTMELLRGETLADRLQTAGVAAVLRQKHPAASAKQIRNAIVMASNPNLLADGSTVLDQGAGYINAGAASALLGVGAVPDTFPEPSSPTKNVKVNIEHGTSLEVMTGVVQVNTGDLKPGQRHDLLYDVTPNTKQIMISLGNVTPGNPPAQQNQLFGDDVLLAVHSAKTSAIDEGDYKVFEFSTGGTFTVNDPEPGIMRITANADWTNAGNISADLFVLSSKEALPKKSVSGKISNGELVTFAVNVPAQVSRAEFRLEFREDWSNYPTSDIDLISSSRMVL